MKERPYEEGTWFAVRLRDGGIGLGVVGRTEFEREFTLANGQRADAVNLEIREVVEVKPNNPRAICLGSRQAQGYAEQLNQDFPGTPFTWCVVTCNRP